MAESKFNTILDTWEIDYLTAVKEKLQKNTQVTSANWMLMDRDHVLGAIRVGDELEKFMLNPPDGWKSISYNALREADFKRLKPFPMIRRARYKQLENIIRYYYPNFYRSKKMMKETPMLYLDENHPVIVWIMKEDLAVFIAPYVVGGE